MVIFPGVLRPPSDARLLIAVMRELGLARGASVLDLFTGSGVLALAAALDGGGPVTAVDVSRRALLNTRFNARLNRIRIRALRGDLFAPVQGERFDLILANPPYLPSEDDRLPAAGASRAWEGGADGRLLVDRFCRSAAGHLSPRGRMLMVHSSLCGEAASLERLAASGLDAETLARRRGPLGPIAAARAEMLERRGLLEPGRREEELLVIGARLAQPAAGEPESG